MKVMETRNQELKKIEDNLKNYLKEHIDKQAEKYDKDLQEVRERQSQELAEVRTLLLYLKPSGVANSKDNLVKPIKYKKEMAYQKIMQSKHTRLEFPKFQRYHLYDWLFKCN